MSWRTWALDGLVVGGGRAEGRVDERIEHMRRLRHRVGEARRGAEKIGEEKPQAIVRLQDGEEFDRCRHAAEGAVEGSERAVGIGGAAERGEQCGRELGQHLPGARALDRGTAAEMPATHGFRHALGLAEAEALQASRAYRDRCPNL